MVSSDGALAMGPSVEARVPVLQEADQPVRRVDRDEVRRLLPLLADAPGPGVLDERGGSIRTIAAVRSRAAGALRRPPGRRRGARRPPHRFRHLEMRSGGRTAEYERVVVCAEPGAALLARGLDLDAGGVADPAALADLADRAAAYVTRALPGLDPEPVGPVRVGASGRGGGGASRVRAAAVRARRVDRRGPRRPARRRAAVRDRRWQPRREPRPGDPPRVVEAVKQALRQAVPPGRRLLGTINVALGRNVRIADVVVVREELVTRDVLAASPEDVVLAVEVVSPSSVTTDRVTEPTQYAAVGIDHYWRVEPSEGPLLAVYERVGGSYVERGTWPGGQEAVLERAFPVRLVTRDLLR